MPHTLDDIHNRSAVADRYVDWLTKGVPTMGWSGDPSLVLAFNIVIQRWELLRHEPNPKDPGRHVVVMTGPPGMEINDQAIIALIRNLIAGDTHRKGNSLVDQMEKVIAKNEKLDRDKTEETVNVTADALGKFYYEAGKTLGVTKAFFPTGPRGLTST